MKHLQDLHVLVLGLGTSGLSMARWCARHGARVRVWDSRAEPPMAAVLLAEVPGAELFFGALDAASLGTAQLILKSPGLSPRDTRIASLMDAARAVDVPVQGELDLYARALADLAEERDYRPAVLAVTGTNGKTTTTAMTALLVERAGKRVAMAGNIGPALLDTLAEALDLERSAVAQAANDPDALPVVSLPEVWVLELSSFQLNGVTGFEPSAAVVLNITQDHLDWHDGMADYAAAKALVYGRSGVMVVNRDDPAVTAMLPPPPAPAAAGGPKAKRTREVLPPPRPVVRFGLSAPTMPGDYGLTTQNGIAWIVRAQPLEAGVRTSPDEPLFVQPLMPADALRVRGRHNAANAQAALALAAAIGCPLAPMLHALRQYRGEPHRVQPVGRIGDVEAYDDSKGTNVGATVAALQGLGADQAPGRLVVILGGDGKGQDFAPLAEPVAAHARAVALIGRDAGRIEDALSATGVAMQRHDSLEDAVQWAHAQAQPGDALLLSPACASLDMFRDYAHRADTFVAALHALAATRGEVMA